MLYFEKAVASFSKSYKYRTGQPFNSDVQTEVS